MPPRLTSIPLPVARFVPGAQTSGPRPGHAAAHSPGWAAAPSRWRESLDYLYGVDLFNDGFFWEAHESLETVWKQLGGGCHGGESGAETAEVAAARGVVRGVIQVSAAAVKREIGNRVGVERLLERAAANFDVRGVDGPGSGLIMGLAVNAWWPEARGALRCGQVPPPIVLDGE